MPHKFLPEIFTVKGKTITFQLPQISAGGPLVVEIGPDGIRDITPSTKLQRRIAEGFEFGDLDPTGDFFTRGIHANVDIVIEESFRGARDFSRGLVQIARGTGGFSRG